MSKLNLKSSMFEKGIDFVKDFLGRLIGPSIDEIGLLYQDNQKVRRVKNMVKNVSTCRGSRDIAKANKFEGPLSLS